jgi:hypothetical protein
MKEYDWIVACELWENLKTMPFENPMGKVCAKKELDRLVGHGLLGC